MRSVWKDIFTALLMGMVLPSGLLNLAVKLCPVKPEPVEKEPTASFQRQTHQVGIRLLEGKVEQWDLDRYLVGVVLAEMPADFEAEALKAQSVAARTYTWKAHITGGKHGDGSVCMESTCCQAYLSEEAYLAQGGTQEGLDKVREAVYATADDVLTYEGEPIEATYFSCSGGRTEDAAAVWGTEFAYLQAVESPGEENAAFFTDTRTFSPQAFQKALGTVLEGSPLGWFRNFTYTDGGGVASVDIGGETYSGTELRSLLGLRSTAFTVAAVEDTITFTTRGYGHRVGMSQYGADAMAVAGSDYAQILAHYYPGTELMDLEEIACPTADSVLQ